MVTVDLYSSTDKNMLKFLTIKKISLKPIFKKVFPLIIVFTFLSCACFVYICVGILITLVKEFRDITPPSNPGNNNLIWANQLTSDRQDKILYSDDKIIIQSGLLTGGENLKTTGDFEHCKREYYYTCIYIIEKEGGNLKEHLSLRGLISGFVLEDKKTLHIFTNHLNSDDDYKKTLVYTLNLETLELKENKESPEGAVITVYSKEVAKDELAVLEDLIGNLVIYNPKTAELKFTQTRIKQDYLKRVEVNKGYLYNFDYGDNPDGVPKVSIRDYSIDSQSNLALSPERLINFKDFMSLNAQSRLIYDKENLYKFIGQKFVAINIETSEVLWTIDLKERYKVRNDWDSLDVLGYGFYKDNLIIGTNYREILSINKSSGEIIWNSKLETSVGANFVILDNKAYFVGFGSGYGLGQINLDTGTLGESVRPRGANGSWHEAYLEVDDNKLYVADKNGVYCFSI